MYNSNDRGMGRAAKGVLFSEEPLFCFVLFCFVLFFFFHSYFRSLIRKTRFGFTHSKQIHPKAPISSIALK